jgi:N-acetylneuraminic acid mutarotase
MVWPLMLLSVTGFGCHRAQYGNGWTQGPALPEPIQEIQAAVFHHRIYIAGGFHAGRAASRLAYRLDPSSNRWERVAQLPQARHHMPLAVVGDSLYAIGGLGPPGMTPAATLWLYDEQADRWLTRAPLPEPRGASAAGVINGKIFVVGGFGPGSRLLDSIAVYDPATNQWRHGTPIPTLRDHLAGAVIDGKLYAIGGRPLDADHNLKVLEAYDPSSDSWTRLAPLPTARGGLAAVALGNRIYTYGGETSSRVFSEHEVYDVATGAWTAAPRLPTARHGLAVAVLDDRIYVIGGGPQAGFAQTEVVEIYGVGRSGSQAVTRLQK